MRVLFTHEYIHRCRFGGPIEEADDVICVLLLLFAVNVDMQRL